MLHYYNLALLSNMGEMMSGEAQNIRRWLGGRGVRGICCRVTAAGAALLVTLLRSRRVRKSNCIHIIPWAALASSGGSSAGRAWGVVSG